MSILVNGKKVHSDEIKGNLAIEFEDLNEFGQKRLFTENKDLFLGVAFVSSYKSIRELAQTYAYTKCSSEALNQLIYELLTKQGRRTNLYINHILDILNSQKLKLENWLAMEFINFNNQILKEWLVNQYPDVTNEILNAILKDQLDDFFDNDVDRIVDAIIIHPKFELMLKGENCGYGVIEKLECRIKELNEK